MPHDETFDNATAAQPVSFAVDLFAFWHVRPWDVSSLDELSRMGRERPREMWDRLLDMVTLSGVQAIELTFAPFDWRTAVAAYGTVDGLRSELASRGLSITSGYMPELEHPGVLGDAAEVRDEAARYAEFLAAVGASTLIGSAPARSTRGSDTATFVDLDQARSLAGLYHSVGWATQRAGVQFALHTESHSAIWLPRDIDLFMAATDPFYVGLCPDAGHLVLGGGDPVAIAQRYVDRLVIAHWKDAAGPISWDLPIDDSVYDAHQAQVRLPGQGVVDWVGWASVMQSAGLTSTVMIETDPSPTPVTDLRTSMSFLEPIIAEVSSRATKPQSALSTGQHPPSRKDPTPRQDPTSTGDHQ